MFKIGAFGFSFNIFLKQSFQKKFFEIPAQILQSQNHTPLIDINQAPVTGIFKQTLETYMT